MKLFEIPCSDNGVLTRLFSTETQWLSGQSINILNRPGAVHTLRFVEILNKIYFFKKYLSLSQSHHWRFLTLNSEVAFKNYKQKVFSFYYEQTLKTEARKIVKKLPFTKKSNISNDWLNEEWISLIVDLQSWEDIAKSCQKVYKLVENIFRICITFFLCILHSVLTDLAARENQKKKLRFTLL